MAYVSKYHIKYRKSIVSKNNTQKTNSNTKERKKCEIQHEKFVCKNHQIQNKKKKKKKKQENVNEIFLVFLPLVRIYC